MILSPRFQNLLKEGFWIIVGQAMVISGSLVGVRLLTGLLSPAEYGELALGVTVATLVNQTVLGPLGQGVMRFYAPATEDDDLIGYLFAVRKLVFVSTVLVICLMLIILASLVLSGQYQWIVITIVSLVFAIVNGCNSILSGIQNAARQRSIVALHQGMESWLRFLSASLLISCFEASSIASMIGYVLGGTIAVCSQFVYFIRAFPLVRSLIEGKKNWQGKIWQYSWPMSVFGLFTWFQLVSDRWVLGIFKSKDEVGMYSALFQLGYYPISMATGMVVQFLAPIFFQRSGDGSDKKRNDNVSNMGWRLTGLAIGLTGVAFCIASLFHTQIFQIFVAKEYRKVSFLFPWMVLSGGIFAASQTIALNLMSQIKTFRMMPIKIVTALLGIALNLAGGYCYGITGIVAAGVMFSMACFLSMVALVKYDN
jgi:O-antigen/teichoic acid export membrane protein